MHMYQNVQPPQKQLEYPLAFMVIEEDNQHSNLSNNNPVHTDSYSAKTPQSYIFFYYIRIAYA